MDCFDEIKIHIVMYTVYSYIHWHLSIVDMLYSGHLTIANTNFKNKVKPIMVISFENKPHCSGHLSIETPLELRTNGVQYREVPLYFRT